jgi:carboxypeptidase Taq
MKTFEDYQKAYLDYRKRDKAFSLAFYLLEWDSETIAPTGCFDVRSEYIGVLSQMRNENFLKEETQSAICFLASHLDKLDTNLQKEIKNIKKTLDKTNKMTQEELSLHSVLISKATQAWAKAKKEKNFSLFEPYLTKIVDYERLYCERVSTKDCNGYDVLLDEFEEGLNQTVCDEFFTTLQHNLVPEIKKLSTRKQKYSYAFNKQTFDCQTQKDYSIHLLNKMGFDFTRGLTLESEHPFTTGFECADVRITNHYYEDNFISSIFTALHEGGHGLFEQQMDKKLVGTFLTQISMSLHESQSRLYENCIGRDKDFWLQEYPTLQHFFPLQLKGVTVDEYFHFINQVTPSLIRTDADEVTYPIHILIRYELEKKLMNRTLEVKDLPKAWNEAYKRYLGVEPANDAEGVLQDIHWAGGSFGYFPTYALGSAYAASIYTQMQKELDLPKIYASGSLKEITNWLRQKVYQYGGSRNPRDLVEEITHKKFSVDDYLMYLKKKISIQ